ncbi:hypothetical protein [Pedobacter frigidisoli]|uniref:hypothetical protein n=1 Tax=Pedobacter frigidisoli TaxID=2530455 RepID=UPI00292E144C|nr:hypothetical protein [Pedobacter frigidisoli]
MKNNKHLITNGVEIPLENIKFHGEAPLKRLLMSGLGTDVNFNMHIAIHEISEPLKFEHRTYSEKHAHNCDEWNILLGEDLIFEITLDDEVFQVKSPSTVFIPKGTYHSANVLAGKGYYIAIVDTIDYKNSFID